MGKKLLIRALFSKIYKEIFKTKLYKILILKLTVLKCEWYIENDRKNQYQEGKTG